MSRILQLLQNALNAASNGVVITDNSLADNPIIFVNPGFERMTGYSASEILGVNCRFLQGEATDDEAIRQMRQAVSEGRNFHAEILNYRKDGSPFWNELAISAVKDASGVVTHFVGIQHEITDRREKEQAQRAQGLAENILKAAPQPLAVLDAEFRIHSANRAFCQLLDSAPESTAGQSLFEIQDGLLKLPALQARLESVATQNTSFDDFELTHHCPRNQSKTWLLGARAIEIEAEATQKTAHILLSVQDISRWCSQSPAHTPFEAEISPDLAVFATDTRGHITSWNSVAQQMFGYTHEEILHQNVSNLFASCETSPDIAADLMRKASIHEKTCVECWMKRKDNLAVWARGSLMALYEDTVFKGFRALLQEETERKNRHDELLCEVEKLSARDRAKDEFLAMLGHELRNPLGAISSAVQVTQMLTSDEELKRPLEIAARQVRQMNTLVGDLLDVARVTQGKVTLKQKHVALDAIVLDVARTSGEQAQAKGLNLHVSVEENVQVYGEATRLEQIVGNLLTNAIKYTPGGEIWLCLKKEGAQAVLTLRDTGIGIDAELLPRLFDLFAQAKRSLARSEGGLGIGLTIVKQLVELHGGQISAHSEGPGHGSEFRASFPLSNYAPESEELEIDNTPVDNRALILVVDDNEDAAGMIATMLELWGYRVEIAHDGNSAIDKTLQTKPSVMLLDIGLPQLNGYQVATQLRQNSEVSNLKIVALTGHGQDIDLHHSRESGFDQHLLKPVEFGTLKELLAAYTTN